MGCISSKSSNHQHPKVQVIIPNTNHKFDHLMELIPPKNDDSLIIHTNLKTDDALKRCSNFHTVEEYDELLGRISNHSDAEMAGALVPAPDATDAACKNDTNIETRDKKKEDMEFQTVASLRQWLHAPGGGSGRGGGDADAMVDHMIQKVGFSFYENNSNSNSNNNNTQGSEDNSILIKNGKQEEEESIVELVAAFDKYMLQLQIDEDNILKQIHHMIN